MTAGGDKVARVWRLSTDVYASLPPARRSSKNHDCSGAKSESSSGQRQGRVEEAMSRHNHALVDWLCDLSAHTTTVNVARFSPTGTRIATAADQGDIMMWTLGGTELGSSGDTSQRERWSQERVFRGHSADVLDLSWSIDGMRLASASVDNSISIWDVSNSRSPVATLSQHGSLVQGVAYDPASRFIASMGSDRSMAVHSLDSFKFLGSSLATANDPKHHYFASDLKCNTVFRRLSWSPDGSFLACPTGLQVPHVDKSPSYAVHVYARGKWTAPVLQCAGLKTMPTVVKFCPRLFSLRGARCGSDDSDSSDQSSCVFQFPYRLLFAVACPEAVLVYDTECSYRPIARISGLHYAEITDLSWDPSGLSLYISSTDGCVSVVAFTADEIGSPLPSENWPAWFPLHDSAWNAKKELHQTAEIERVTPITAVNVIPRRKFVQAPQVPSNSSKTSPASIQSHAQKPATDSIQTEGEAIFVVPRRKRECSSNGLSSNGDKKTQTCKRLKLEG